MEQFKQKYIEEAVELIGKLEKSLLVLENDPEESNMIQEIFRIMHTLKGNSAMFGFEFIDSFTHELETIYDQVRNNKRKLSKTILNLSLSSVDHLHLLLSCGNELDAETKQTHDQLLEQIIAVISNGVEEEHFNNEEQETDVDDNIQTKEIEILAELEENTEVESSYYVEFKPHSEILRYGTNPLFLVDDLSGLGDCITFARIDNIPKFEDLDPTLCYMDWVMIISTTHDLNAIKDVFIFVEDECDLLIEKLTDTNICNDEDFCAKAEVLLENKECPDFNYVKKMIETSDGILEIKSEVVSKKISKEKGKRTLVKEKTFKSRGNKNGTGVTENVISSVRVSSDKLDSLMNLVSELVTTQARLGLYSENKDDTELLAISENVQKLSRQLRDNAFSICLVPIETLITRFQRLVRDLSKELDKPVSFIAEGTETELDKTIIESLTDPMLHILRNCIDHGIENAEEREKTEKEAQGTILLKSFYSGPNVIIQVKDDGAGIDREKVFKVAVEKGLVSPDAKLTDKEVYELVFLAGFSTVDKVTELSGRGVGMDVVRKKINEIRGEVSIDSEAGHGTTITVKLPLTLSIIDGLLVLLDETSYLIPLSVINKIHPVKHTEFVDNFNKMLILDGEQIPYHYLREQFEITSTPPEMERVILVEYEEKMIGIVVDRVLGEYQAVLKPLGRMYKGNEMMSGATILGDGTVALVMDTNKIIHHFSDDNITI